MIETKPESQNYFANPYSDVGSLPFDTEYVILSIISFFFFLLRLFLFPSRLHAFCHLSNSRESGVIRRTQKPLSVPPPRVGSSSRSHTIHQFIPFPCIRSPIDSHQHRR
jgi:hypothetical protein